MNKFSTRMSNIFHLGIKEFHSLLHDMAMLVMIVFMFTASIYLDARAKPDSLNHAAIAVVDEDQSQLSLRLVDAMQAPYFRKPILLSLGEVDQGMDSGRDTFVLNIPPNFQRDVQAGRIPVLQLNVDATRQSQALIGSAYIQKILNDEVLNFSRHDQPGASALPAELTIRVLSNPNLHSSWFGSITAIINNVTLLSIILSGAALIREREHGTIEHLLVMPVTPLEIMLSKVWSMATVVLMASIFALQIMVKGVLDVTVNGSGLLFAMGTLVYLFATTSIGIFMGTLARTMPQFGLMAILVLLPLQMLSGAVTPRESMPQMVQWIMSLTPTVHFVALAQAILFRAANMSVIWPQLLAIIAIGLCFFLLAHYRLRKTLGAM
ncbi:MAG: hypothetical protein RL571_1231 [Pseudomonadota bacterium]|jgi:ABC-2 type transport system permease protein